MRPPAITLVEMPYGDRLWRTRGDGHMHLASSRNALHLRGMKEIITETKKSDKETVIEKKRVWDDKAGFAALLGLYRQVGIRTL